LHSSKAGLASLSLLLANAVAGAPANARSGAADDGPTAAGSRILRYPQPAHEVALSNPYRTTINRPNTRLKRIAFAATDLRFRRLTAAVRMLKGKRSQPRSGGEGRGGTVSAGRSGGWTRNARWA